MNDILVRGSKSYSLPSAGKCEWIAACYRFSPSLNYVGMTDYDHTVLHLMLAGF